jgi:hypothetical protein
VSSSTSTPSASATTAPTWWSRSRTGSAKRRATWRGASPKSSKRSPDTLERRTASLFYSESGVGEEAAAELAVGGVLVVDADRLAGYEMPPPEL